MHESIRSLFDLQGLSYQGAFGVFGAGDCCWERILPLGYLGMLLLLAHRIGTVPAWTDTDSWVRTTGWTVRYDRTAGFWF